MVAPSGGAGEPDRPGRGAAALAALGFEVVVASACEATYGYLAGPDALRAADINRFFADPSIAGIVCMKGGYGAPRILDALDYEAIARNPKPLVGYSDVTGLHLAIGKLCGLATFHGPMPSSDMLPEFHEFSRRSWLAALTSTLPLGRIEEPEGPVRMERLAGGRARGPIVGGNLSLLAATMGTRYQVDARGKILFLEDVDEAPYRVDRMLTQLRLAGAFRDCEGVILGDWKRCEPAEGKSSLTLMQVFEDVILPCGKPVVCGLRAGHCEPAITLPLGVEAILDADGPSLELVEAAAV
jgi:muramoyltetrapeptide carboxypeptidase